MKKAILWTTCAILFAAASSHAQTAIKAGEKATEDGYFLTKSEMQSLSDRINEMRRDLALAREEAVHQKELAGICATEASSKASAFLDELKAREHKIAAVQEECSAWERRWKNSEDYAEKLEKRCGGAGFWNNRKVQFLMDAAIVTGIFLAADRTRQ